MLDSLLSKHDSIAAIKMHKLITYRVDVRRELSDGKIDLQALQSDQDITKRHCYEEHKNYKHSLLVTDIQR